MLPTPLPPSSLEPQASSLSVALLAGGDSAERAISLRSGGNVAEALASRGHAVETIDPAETDLTGVDWSRFDVCFLALHGGAGEDGRVQQLLEDVGIPYTGSGPTASRLAMSKSAAKRCFLEAGVPTCDYVLADAAASIGTIAAEAARLGYPLIVKPDCEGSSLGVGAVQRPEELPAALAAAWQFGPLAIIEPLIAGPEYTVALLGRRALPAIEILPADKLFSYEAKYADPTTRFRVAPLPPDEVDKLVGAAIQAADALGVRGLARVDVLRNGRGDFCVLEVNTIPGLTARSLAPLAASSAGLDLAALCQWMIDDCLHLPNSSVLLHRSSL